MHRIHRWPYVLLVVGSILIWAILRSLSAERPDTNPNNLSTLAIIVLSVTIIVPYFLTWILATLSWYRLKQLTLAGQRHKWPFTFGFQSITTGVGFLLADLIGTTLVSSIRNIFLYDYAQAMVLTIIYNLMHVVLLLLAFIYIYRGSKDLLGKSKYAKQLRSRWLPTLLPVIIFASFFSLLVFTGSMRQFTSKEGELAIYFLPDVLIFLTVVVPLAIAWLLGLRSALNLEQFTHSLPDRKGRAAVIRFYNGLLAVIGSSIILQALTALGSERLESLGLTQTLILLYLWVIVQASAYSLLSHSAKSLYKFVETNKS